MSKKTLVEREQELVLKIQKAKKELDTLQKKQRQEIGALACKHGLNNFETSILDKAFSELSVKLTKENKNVAA